MESLNGEPVIPCGNLDAAGDHITAGVHVDHVVGLQFVLGQDATDRVFRRGRGQSIVGGRTDRRGPVACLHRCVIHIVSADRDYDLEG